MKVALVSINRSLSCPYQHCLLFIYTRSSIITINHSLPHWQTTYVRAAQSPAPTTFLYVLLNTSNLWWSRITNEYVCAWIERMIVGRN
jgi:hypothetical protein